MSLRIVNLTTLAWWLLALQIGPAWWSSITAVSAQNPPPGPKTVEAQAKFFQDFFSVQLSPHKLEFGHVCEDPHNWEQRYERKDFKNHRDMGKVRWGDKKGGYGEHYWDLNHAGHNNDNDHDHESYEHGSDDDGSYHPEASDPYDEPSEQLPTYNSDDAYDPEKSSKSVYDESGRNKRAHPRLRVDRKPQEYQEEDKSETQRVYRPRNKERKTQNIAKTTPKYVHDESNNDEVTEQPKKQKQNKGNKLKINVDDNIEDTQEVKKPSLEESFPNVPNRPKAPYVPYATGAGVRRYNPELTAASAPPRLFLDPSTGHIVDRSTGQAYVLQPLRANNYN